MIAAFALAAAAAPDPAWVEAVAAVAAAVPMGDVALVELPDGREALAAGDELVVLEVPATDGGPARIEQVYVALARLRAPRARPLAALVPVAPPPSPPRPSPRVAAAPAAPVPAPPPVAPAVQAPHVEPPPASPAPPVVIAAAPPPPTAAVVQVPAPPAPREWALALAVGVVRKGVGAAVTVERRAGAVAVGALIGLTGEPEARGAGEEIHESVPATSVDLALAAHLVHPTVPLRTGASLGATHRTWFLEGARIGTALVPVASAWVGTEIRRGALLLRPEAGVAHDLRATRLDDEGDAIALEPTRGVVRVAVGVVR